MEKMHFIILYKGSDCKIQNLLLNKSKKTEKQEMPVSDYRAIAFCKILAQKTEKIVFYNNHSGKMKEIKKGGIDFMLNNYNFN